MCNKTPKEQKCKCTHKTLHTVRTLSYKQAKNSNTYTHGPYLWETPCRSGSNIVLWLNEYEKLCFVSNTNSPLTVSSITDYMQYMFFYLPSNTLLSATFNMSPITPADQWCSSLDGCLKIRRSWIPVHQPATACLCRVRVPSCIFAEWLSVCVTPMTDWWPVKGVFHLLSCESGDGPQTHRVPEL